MFHSNSLLGRLNSMGEKSFFYRNEVKDGKVFLGG